MAFNGRVNTSEYLYSLNLGPKNMWILCGDDYESLEHRVVNCRKSRLIWNDLGYKTNHVFLFPDGFYLGEWLTHLNHSIFSKFVIVVTTWYIWKSHCDAIFNHAHPNFHVIQCRSLAHTRDFSLANRNQLGRRIILNNFSDFDGLFLFSSTVWNEAMKVGRPGC